MSPVQVVVRLHQLGGRQGGELRPVDVVVLDPLLTQADHLEADVLSLSITVKPQTQVLRLLGQLLPRSQGDCCLLRGLIITWRCSTILSFLVVSSTILMVLAWNS